MNKPETGLCPIILGVERVLECDLSMEPTRYFFEECEAVVRVKIFSAKLMKTSDARDSELVACPDNEIVIAHLLLLLRSVELELTPPLLEDAIVAFI